MEKADQVNPWEQANIPQPGVMSATEAYRAITETYETFRLAGQPATDEIVLNTIAKSIGCEQEELKLGGPVDIAKGNKHVLLLTGHQDFPAHILNRIPAGALVGVNELYASITNPGAKTKAEAIVKWRSGFQGTTPDHLTISEQLAKSLDLDLNAPGEIVIEAMYQKTQDINLDDF